MTTVHQGMYLVTWKTARRRPDGSPRFRLHQHQYPGQQAAQSHFETLRNQEGVVEVSLAVVIKGAQ